MIITLTLNPAIDTTLTVNSFKVGDTNRTNFIRRDPGGKGINVSRALLAMKEDVMTLSVVGGHSGRMFIDLTSRINMEMTWIEVEGETRMNFVVGDIETGTRTKIDQPGPFISGESIEKIFSMVKEVFNESSFLVLSGKLPPGMPDDTYFQLIKIANSQSVRTVLDVDGPALIEGIQSKPFMVSPNIREAEEFLGRRFQGEAGIADAVREMRDNYGISIVACTLGEAGVVAATDDGIYRLIAPNVNVQCTVGAGDAFVAGTVAGLYRNYSIKESLAFGVAAGTASTMEPGSATCHLEKVNEVLPNISIEKVSD